MRFLLATPVLSLLVACGDNAPPPTLRDRVDDFVAMVTEQAEACGLRFDPAAWEAVPDRFCDLRDSHPDFLDCDDVERYRFDADACRRDFLAQGCVTVGVPELCERCGYLSVPESCRQLWIGSFTGNEQWGDAGVIEIP